VPCGGGHTSGTGMVGLAQMDVEKTLTFLQRNGVKGHLVGHPPATPIPPTPPLRPAIWQLPFAGQRGV
jgi:hypothetical protein